MYKLNSVTPSFVFETNNCVQSVANAMDFDAPALGTRQTFVVYGCNKADKPLLPCPANASTDQFSGMYDKLIVLFLEQF
jgi:hypothetical protein